MSCGKPVFVFQRAFPIFRDDLDVARRKPKVSNVSAYAAVSAQVTKAEIEDWRSRQKDLVERGKYADSVVRKNIRRERTEYIVKTAPAESDDFEDSLIEPIAVAFGFGEYGESRGQRRRFQSAANKHPLD